MPRKNKTVVEPQVATGVVVRLRHTTRQGDWRFYHYEGEMPVVDGVLTIPADLPEVIKRAWIQGFRMTAEGRVIADLAKHVRAETADMIEQKEPESCCGDECCQPETEELALACCTEATGCCENDDNADCACVVTPVAETETAESGEETDTDEGSADRGQPVEDDGVRSSEPDGDGSLPEGGVDGRLGDEPADGGAGDESAD